MSVRENRINAIKSKATSNTPSVAITKREHEDPDLVDIRDSYRSTLNAGRNYIKFYIETGIKLINKKKSMPHGTFLNYIDSNRQFLGFDRRVANNHMRIAEKQDLVQHAKSIREALRIIRTSENNDGEKEINPEDSVKSKILNLKTLLRNFKAGQNLTKEEKTDLRKYLKGERAALQSKMALKIEKIEGLISALK